MGAQGGSIASVTTVAAVQDVLEALAPIGKAGAWDPVGIQIGDPGREVTRVAVCHEATSRVVDRVVADGIDLLVSYHPLLFRPISKLTAGSGPAGRALALAGAGVSLVVVHTAYDVAKGGTADALADALGLADTRGFDPLWGGEASKVVTFVPEPAVEDVIDAMAAAGAGQIGAYSRCAFVGEGTGTYFAEPGAAPAIGRVGERSTEAETRVEMVVPETKVAAVVAALAAVHPYEEPPFDIYERRGDTGFLGRVGTFRWSFEKLIDRVRSQLGPALRLAGRAEGEELTVGVVPGSGARAIPAAADVGAAVLVTGDVKHHDARAAAERGVAIVDPGHAATERPGVARLYAAVAAAVDGAVDLTGIDADPWT